MFLARVFVIIVVELRSCEIVVKRSKTCASFSWLYTTIYSSSLTPLGLVIVAALARCCVEALAAAVPSAALLTVS